MTRSRRLLCLALVAALAVSGCSFDEAVPQAAPTTATEDPSASPSTAGPTDEAADPTSEPTPAASPSASASPSPSATPAPPPEPDPAVAAVQQQLTDLGYYVGPVDGLAGAATHHAVMAFQKVNGLQRDGVIGPQTLAALEAPVEPVIQVGGDATRVEVDLDLQVLHYVADGVRVRTIPVSSGNGQLYTNSRGQARALTPIGVWRIQREIRGVREADLGTLFDPKYYWRGFAIHGSNSVPAYEASHGCIRVPRADMLWLFDRMPIGTQLVVHGGRHVFEVAPEYRGDTDTTNESGQPTVEPTPEPTPDPTAEPTDAPTAQPTAEPTDDPTDEPTPEPTADPTDEPAPEPTEQPTGEPTEQPTEQPTEDPSAAPTDPAPASP